MPVAFVMATAPFWTADALNFHRVIATVTATNLMLLEFVEAFAQKTQTKTGCATTLRSQAALHRRPAISQQRPQKKTAAAPFLNQPMIATTTACIAAL